MVLPIKDYKKIIEALEDLQDAKLYDEAMADEEPSLPIDEVFKYIEVNTQK